jgi:hypothetical protein
MGIVNSNIHPISRCPHDGVSRDGSLELWSVNDFQIICMHKGQVNNRSFLGLSVWRNGGLLGCRSESNEVEMGRMGSRPV